MNAPLLVDWASRRLARTERPALIVAGASAYLRVIDFERMAAIAHGVGARLMVDMAHIAGLVATGAPTLRPCRMRIS